MVHVSLDISEAVSWKSSNSEHFHIKTNILFTFFFSWIAICTDGSKAMMDKFADTLAQIKAVEPNYIKSHCILHHALTMKKKKASYTCLSLIKHKKLSMLLN